MKNCQINKLSKTTFETVLNIVLQVCPSVSPFVSELFTTSSNLPLRKKLFMKQGAVNKRIQNMLVLQNYEIHLQDFSESLRLNVNAAAAILD